MLQTSSASCHKNHTKKKKQKCALQAWSATHPKKPKKNVVLQVSSATFKNTKKWMQPSYNTNNNDNLEKEKKGTTMFYYKI